MAKDYAKDFYHSKTWVKCRSSFMTSKYYLCERCEGVAVICHHKTHITPANINDPNITLSWDNLQALCVECHNVVHGNSQVTQDGLRFDANGNLIKAPGNKNPANFPETSASHK
jgi:5-methylcytosine-specific restriction endonuclease McrA